MKCIKITVASIFAVVFASCGGSGDQFRKLGTLDEERMRCYNLSLPGISSDEIKKRCDWVGITNSKALFQLATHHSDACLEILQTVLYSCMAQVGERKLDQEAAKKRSV